LSVIHPAALAVRALISKPTAPAVIGLEVGSQMTAGQRLASSASKAASRKWTAKLSILYADLNGKRLTRRGLWLVAVCDAYVSP